MTTLEVLVSLLTAAAAVLSAVAAILSARRSQKVLVKAGTIEKATDGAATAMEADRKALRSEVLRLEKEIVEKTAAAVMDRLASQQAAADVRAAMKASQDDGKGQGGR